MVRTKVNNKEIGHLFAAQSQPYCNASNQSFRGNLFYSYSTEIAALRTNDSREIALFFDATKYSQTTSIHQSKLKYACNHYTVFEFEQEISYYQRGVRPSEVTADFLYEYYVEKAKSFQEAAKKAKKHKLSNLETSKGYIEKANRLIDWFGVTHLDKLDEDSLDDVIAELREKEEERLRKEKERAIASLNKQLEETKEDFDRWLSGEKVQFPSVWNNKGVFLRVAPDDVDTVVTSRGAVFPKKSCEAIYKLFRRSQREEEVYTPNLKVGVYLVNKVSKEGVIAGCHHILPDEIERFAQVINLKEVVEA